jgi:hypothetical protein
VHVISHRFMHGVSLMSPIFKPRHSSLHLVISWGIEMMVLLGDKRVLGSSSIDWLVWRFTTIVARHYMHMAKMKWHRIIKVLEHNVRASFEQGALIPNTHVNHEIDNLIERGHAWMVQSTHLLDVKYKVPLPFTHYMCCMCEWTLCGNLCKHQVVVFITCIDFTPKNIIHYCGSWYGSNCGNFETMFTNPTYLHFYDKSNDGELRVEDPWVVDVGGFMTQMIP